MTWTHETPAGRLGEQPEGGGDALSHADGTAQRDLLHLESELAQTLAEGQCQAQEYQPLLNIEVKLEAEIATYHHLLEEGEDFTWCHTWQEPLHTLHARDLHQSSEALKAAEVGHPLGNRRSIKSSEIKKFKD